MNLIVVGNKFSEFSKIKQVITLDSLLYNLETDLEFINRYDYISFGQGINIVSAKEIIRIVKNKISISGYDVLETKEDPKYVHKKRSNNVVITKPLKLNDNTFISNLIVENDCEILDDHVTGIHLQGMLMQESARQMMISIIENFFLPHNEQFKKRFTLVNIQSNFKQFIFPLNVEIRTSINILSRKDNRIYAEITCHFTQFHKICAVIKIKFLTEDENITFQRETFLVNHILNN